MSLSHEDIRYKVIQKLRESILCAIEEIRRKKINVYLRLQPQLEEYKKLIEKKEDIPLIIRNEKIIKGVGKPDVEVLGGKILIEVKVKLSEFPSGFDQLSKYVKFYPCAEYGIITNYDRWEFYKIEKGSMISVHGVTLEAIIDEIFTKGVKVPLSTANVRNMFNPIVISEEELRYIFNTYGQKGQALYEAYKNIIKRLYEKASEEDIERLFIRHTLMQMIVSSCLTASSKKRTSPIRACSGAEIEIEVVLPYLKWWEFLLKEMEPSDNEFLNSLLESIYSKSLLLNWESGGKEDIFRELYEILIDAETRRKIGEYYTPLWLVEYMVNKAHQDMGTFKGKKVLDPFCGSGTFLVTTFYKKVKEGEDPDVAIKEVIGFDINPLAVSVARAELMIAYQSVRKGRVTPLVFNTDSASLLLRAPGKWEPVSFLDELKEIEKEIEYVNSPIYKSTDIDFSEILKIEMILRERFREVSRSENIEKELGKKLDELKKEGWKGALTSHIVDTLAKRRSVNAIASLIKKYGNGVWAASITSLFAPQIIRKVKVDMVITNPPWAQLTEPKGSYGELLREKAKKLISGYNKSAQILNGSDVSSILLYGGINIAQCKVAFLIPQEVVYTAGSFYGLGKILTYNAIKKFEGEVVQVEFDAFQHGRLPCIIFLNKNRGKILCYSMRIECRDEYTKALHLSEIKYEVKRELNYRSYIKKVELYIQATHEMLKKRLRIKEVMPMGEYVRGLFGGKKKKGAKKYAGLVFEIINVDETSGQYSIRLNNTRSTVKIPEYFLSPYWKRIIYPAEVFPFHLNNVYNILLSQKGANDLKEFLERHIQRNISEEEDREKVNSLIDELKQPEALKLLKPVDVKYYVIYRRIRTFVSFVLTANDINILTEEGKKGIVIYDVCAYISMNNETQAYYYSALINYLVYKVLEKGGAFERNQYLRPLIAILNANLEWKAKEWQVKIAELGKELHNSTSLCFKNFIKKGMRVEECFKRLKKCSETKKLFENLINTFDQNVNKKKLYDSLKFVCKLRKA